MALTAAVDVAYSRLTLPTLVPEKTWLRVSSYTSYHALLIGW